ncbi:MAG: hypothetical protein KF765_12440 [Parvibaculaceae bacterium]|nr:hypothetical protein [Parvibaculaceae bacterium]
MSEAVQQSERRKHWRDAAMWIIGIPLFLFIIIVIAEGPKTQIEIDTEQCIREKGFGNWRGSLGISLEQFCKASAQYKAILQHRRDHPELY